MDSLFTLLVDAADEETFKLAWSADVSVVILPTKDLLEANLKYAENGEAKEIKGNIAIREFLSNYN